MTVAPFGQACADGRGRDDVLPFDGAAMRPFFRETTMGPVERASLTRAARVNGARGPCGVKRCEQAFCLTKVTWARRGGGPCSRAVRLQRSLGWCVESGRLGRASLSRIEASSIAVERGCSEKRNYGKVFRARSARLKARAATLHPAGQPTYRANEHGRGVRCLALCTTWFTVRR